MNVLNVYYCLDNVFHRALKVELAEELGISFRFVQQFEGKNVPNVRLDMLEVLASNLQIQPQELVK